MTAPCGHRPGPGPGPGHRRRHRRQRRLRHAPNSAPGCDDTTRSTCGSCTVSRHVGIGLRVVACARRDRGDRRRVELTLAKIPAHAAARRRSAGWPRPTPSTRSPRPHAAGQTIVGAGGVCRTLPCQAAAASGSRRACSSRHMRRMMRFARWRLCARRASRRVLPSAVLRARNA